jgi:hypothetical protein
MSTGQRYQGAAHACAVSLNPQPCCTPNAIQPARALVLNSTSAHMAISRLTSTISTSTA